MHWGFFWNSTYGMCRVWSDQRPVPSKHCCPRQIVGEQYWLNAAKKDTLCTGQEITVTKQTSTSLSPVGWLTFNEERIYSKKGKCVIRPCGRMQSHRLWEPSMKHAPCTRKPNPVWSYNSPFTTAAKYLPKLQEHLHTCAHRALAYHHARDLPVCVCVDPRERMDGLEEHRKETGLVSQLPQIHRGCLQGWGRIKTRRHCSSTYRVTVNAMPGVVSGCWSLQKVLE